MPHTVCKLSLAAAFTLCMSVTPHFIASSHAAETIKIKRIEVPLEQLEDEQSENRLAQSSEAEAETENEGLGVPTDELPETQPDGSLTAQPDYSEKPDDKTTEGPLPEIQRDFSKLPEPVKRMRSLILEAARKGEIEKLRSLIGSGETATNLSLGELEGDPIDHLKSLSGDNDGLEILGILIEILEMGYVHLDAGTDDEMYVWPYFFSWPIKSLSAEQKVEMYTVLTAGDVEDSVNFGGYIFYRAGIKPDGSWNFFVSGD